MKVKSIKINFSHTGDEKKELIKIVNNRYENEQMEFKKEKETFDYNKLTYEFIAQCNDARSGIEVEFTDKFTAIAPIINKMKKAKTTTTKVKLHWRTMVSNIAEEKNISFAEAKKIWKKNN